MSANPLLEYAILATLFGAFTLFFWFCLNLYASVAASRREAWSHLSDYERLQQKSFITQIRPLLQMLVRLNDKFALSRRWMERAAQRWAPVIVRAGSPGHITGQEFLALKQISPVAVLIVLAVFGVNQPAVVLILAAFSYFLPDLWLNDQTRARKAKMIRSLPDALDTLSLMVQAGLDFGQAVDIYIRISEAGPLLSEFSLAQSEVRLGSSRPEALRAMAERVDCVPLTNFTTAVIQSQRMGSSMAEVLAAQSQDLRTKRFQLAEELGQKAPVKMLIPLLLLILPNIFIVLFAPMALKFFQGGF